MAKYSYVLILVVLLIGEIDRDILLRSLSVPANNQEGLGESSKRLTITNQTSTLGGE